MRRLTNIYSQCIMGRAFSPPDFLANEYLGETGCKYLLVTPRYRALPGNRRKIENFHCTVRHSVVFVVFWLQQAKAFCS